MRRTEMIEGVNQLIQAITNAEIPKILARYMQSPSVGKQDDFTQAAFKAMQSYSISAKGFNDAAVKVSSIMGLSDLNSPDFWSLIVSPERIARVVATGRSVNFVLENLPKLVKLIEPTATRNFKDSIERPTPTYANKDILSVVLIESDDHFSSPDRLVEMLQGVNLLYEASLIILDAPHDKLSVIACDSGSDKSFDFMGAAKVVECVVGIILSMWDRIVFYREKKVEGYMDLVTKSLPIIEKIGELEQQNKVGPEQAELLRRNIINGVSKFAASGAIIPQIEKNTYFNPRALLAPEPKLLTTALPSSPEIATIPAPPDAEGRQNPGSGIDDDLDFAQLNDEEQEFLKSIVTKFRNSNARKTADQNKDQDGLSNEEIDPNDE